MDSLKELRKIEFSEISIGDRLSISYEVFGDGLVATSSFQSQSVPLLHLISKHVPELPILFLDTGFHFPETLSFKEKLTDQFGLKVIDITNNMGHQSFKQRYGNLYKSDPDQCCYINKVEPLERMLKNYKAWISGIRRDQTSEREKADFIQKLDNGITKICPILDWTNHDIWTYVNINELPQHPLLDQGYLSIGCAPCTQPVKKGNQRSGRWFDKSKTECGLHNNLGRNKSNEET